jgi:hypothetical protein
LSQGKNTDASGCRKIRLDLPALPNRVEKAEKAFYQLKEWCFVTASSSISSAFDSNMDFSIGQWNKLKNIALVLTFNWPISHTVGLLKLLYEPYFAVVIFCGTVQPDHVYRERTIFPLAETFNFIDVTEKEILQGNFAHVCTSKAIELHLPNIDGYMVIADDTLYNFWNDFDTSRFRLWGTYFIENNGGTPWGHTEWGFNAMNRSLAMIKERTSQFPDSPLSRCVSREQYAHRLNFDYISVF